MADSPIEITQPILLIVEGRDEYVFFQALLNFMKSADPIQILNFGGKDRLGSQLKAYRLVPNFNIVKAIGIIRDADDSADSAWQSVQTALKAANLTVPISPETMAAGSPAVNVMITPGSGKPGKLETMCLEAISNEPAMVCVNQYLDCVQRIHTGLDLEKAKLQTFIAGVPKASVRLIGDAAYAGYLNFESVVYAGTMSFLRALGNSATPEQK